MKPICKDQVIDPELFEKFLTMGNIEFVKKYGGFLKPEPGGPSPRLWPTPPRKTQGGK